MGGRRARSLVEIVGTGLSGLRANFTRAVGQENPDGVVSSSAQLIAKSGKIAEIVYYVSQLTNFVRRVVESHRDLNHEKRVELARKEWSRFKKKENLEDDPIVTNAVVSAVAKAIGKARK